MLTAVRRLCGQPSTRPIGVVDQSRVCISDPISPAPASAMGRGSYLGERSAIEPLGMRRRAGKQPMAGHPSPPAPRGQEVPVGNRRTR